MKLWTKTTKLIICYAIPIVLLPLALSSHLESRCAYVLLFMAFYWILEPVALAVTALLPVFLMPLLGILSASEVAANYMKEVLMMYVGGLAVAVAVEHSNLHERIALKVLSVIGGDTKWLMLGFMTTTMFLSMWISNTATTAMMVPIVEAVMNELRVTTTLTTHSPGVTMSSEALHKTLLLSVAYSANCGGTGTLTGTSPNMILKGFIEDHYPESTEITFASWMMYNVPGMLLCVLVSWVVLQMFYAPCWRKQSESSKDRIKGVIRSRYQELGPITFHESAVFGLFVLLVILWIFRDPKFIPGWASLFNSEVRIGDSTPVIGIMFLLFLFPANPRNLRKSPALLEWPVVQKKLPWGLVILLGGGYALANGTQKSGLSKWLGAELERLSFLSPPLLLFILCASTAAFTEIMSNSTVTTILLPVINQMAITFEVHPLYLMLPVTIVSSYAFMLPVATPPNAIVFEGGHMKTIDMVKPGIVMNVICCCIQWIMINTLGVAMFGLNTFPDYIKRHQTIGSFNGTDQINATNLLAL